MTRVHSCYIFFSFSHFSLSFSTIYCQKRLFTTILIQSAYSKTITAYDTLHRLLSTQHSFNLPVLSHAYIYAQTWSSRYRRKCVLICHELMVVAMCGNNISVCIELSPCASYEIRAFVGHVLHSTCELHHFFSVHLHEYKFNRTEHFCLSILPSIYIATWSNRIESKIVTILQ